MKHPVSNTKAYDPQRCPLCQEDNACQAENIQAGKLERCWCMDTLIPEAAKEQLTEKSFNKQCICQCCAERFTSKPLNP